MLRYSTLRQWPPPGESEGQEEDRMKRGMVDRRGKAEAGGERRARACANWRPGSEMAGRRRAWRGGDGEA